jgi:butyrate kinase
MDNPGENDMTEISAWHLDVETAQKEVQACFAKWQELTNRIQKIVDGHEAYAPDAFEASLEELMAEYKRAANAVVARLGIMAQIKAGKMQFSVEGPDQTTG